MWFRGTITSAAGTPDDLPLAQGADHVGKSLVGAGLRTGSFAPGPKNGIDLDLDSHPWIGKARLKHSRRRADLAEGLAKDRPCRGKVRRVRQDVMNTHDITQRSTRGAQCRFNIRKTLPRLSNDVISNGHR
jgi:hypothetical protein